MDSLKYFKKALYNLGFSDTITPMNTTPLTPNYVPSSALFAQLLSKENLTVNTNNQNKTATFDTENRVLTLPNWTGFETDAWYLLIAHEVGHALFTPETKVVTPHLNRMAAAYGINTNQVFTVLNCIEDIRIERKIRDKYRGLTGAFHRGYTELVNNNFFGFGTPQNLIDNKWSKYKTLDKLNLYAKVGGIVEVKLTDPNHIRWYNESLVAETFKDVVRIAEDIIKTIQGKKEEAPEETKPQSSANSNKKESAPQKSSPKEEKERPTDNNTQDIEESDEPKEPGNGNSPQPSKKDDSKDDSEDGEGEGDSEDGESDGEGDSEDTEDTNEDSKNSKSKNAANGDVADEIINKHSNVGATEFVSNTQNYADKILNNSRSTHTNRIIIDDNKLKTLNYDDQSHATMLAGWNCNDRTRVINIMNNYHNKSKMVLSGMVSKFRALQTATTSRRIKITKTGTIDTNKLHSYQLIEDIFLRQTDVPNGQNHGFVLNLDWSGSMQDSLSTVLWQTLNLIWFAEQIKVPIEVYAFSSSTYKYDVDVDIARKNCGNGMWSAHYPVGRQLQLYTSSCANKKESQAYIFSLISQFVGRANKLPKDIANLNTKLTAAVVGSIRIDSLGYTPLHNAMVASISQVKAFREKHKLEKCVSIWLTDGSNSSVIVLKDPATCEYPFSTAYSSNTYYSPATGKEYSWDTDNSVAIEYHRDMTGATVVVIHLCDRLNEVAFSYLRPNDQNKTIDDDDNYHNNGTYIITRKQLGYGPDVIIATTTKLWNGEVTVNETNLARTVSDDQDVVNSILSNIKNMSLKKFSEMVVPYLAKGREIR